MGCSAGAPGLSHAPPAHQVTLLSMLQGTLSILQVSRDILYDSKGQISTAAILAHLYDCQTDGGNSRYVISLDVNIISLGTNFPMFHSSC